MILHCALSIIKDDTQMWGSYVCLDVTSYYQILHNLIDWQSDIPQSANNWTINYVSWSLNQVTCWFTVRRCDVQLWHKVWDISLIYSMRTSPNDAIPVVWWETQTVIFNIINKQTNDRHPIVSNATTREVRNLKFYTEHKRLFNCAADHFLNSILDGMINWYDM